QQPRAKSVCVDLPGAQGGIHGEEHKKSDDLAKHVGEKASKFPVQAPSIKNDRDHAQKQVGRDPQEKQKGLVPVYRMHCEHYSPEVIAFQPASSAAAKAAIDFAVVTARLKPCPFKTNSN